MAETRPKWVNALDPTFRAIFHETENSFETMYDKIFHVMDSNKAFEKDTALSGIGQLEEVNELGAIPYEDATQVGMSRIPIVNLLRAVWFLRK